MIFINSILVSLLYLTFVMFNVVDSSNSVLSPQCRTHLKSSCPNYTITKWNKNDVSQNLKSWIRTIFIEWNIDKIVPGGRHCKMFVMKPNYFYHKYAPDATSPDVMIIAKIMPENNSDSNSNKRPKLYGPVWADIHNGHEWNIKETPGRQLSAKVSSDALLANGLYYGVINNDQLKLGNNIEVYLNNLNILTTI